MKQQICLRVFYSESISLPNIAHGQIRPSSVSINCHIILEKFLQVSPTQMILSFTLRPGPD